MVNQNSNPPQPSSGQDAQPSKEPAQSMSSPSVVKAGEMMLIFALVLIFLVCLAVSVHFYLRQKKRRRRAMARTKKKEMKKMSQPELQSREKKIAELVGTPLCEMGESEPRHEMEDVEVHERFTTIDLANPADSPAVVSSLEPDLEAGTMAIDEMTTTTWQPEAGTHAMYWSRGL